MTRAKQLAGAKQLARSSDDFTQGGSASDALIGKSRAQDETDYFQQAVEKAESRGQLTAGQKVGAAARREAEAAAREGGSASITRFLSTSGAKQANTLQKRGQRWRDAKQEKGAFKTLIGASGGKQRRMIGDIAADTAQEAAATLPMSYAADSAMGLTGAPSDEEFYDVGAQTEAAVEYLPTFAAYEVAGRAALGGVGAALQGAGKAASKYMSGPEGTGIAKTVSNAFTAISDTAKAMGASGSQAEARFNQRVRGSGSTGEMVKRGYEQAGKFMKDRKGALKDAASRRLARGDSRVKRSPAETSSSLLGAKQLFGREAGRNALTEMAVGSSGRPEDEAVAALQDVKSTLFKQGDQPRSRVARMLGGDAVSYGELKRSNIEMAEETQRQMKSIKQGLDDARRQVEAEAGNVTNNKAAGLIGSMAERGAEGLRVSGYMKKGGEVMRVPTGQDARAGAEITKCSESCCGKKTAAAKRKRPALLPRKPGVSAHVALRRNGSGLSVPTCASKTRPGPKANARPLASLFLLISVTPASQFLLTARGGILVHYTSPVVTERKLAHRGGLFVFLPARKALASLPVSISVQIVRVARLVALEKPLRFRLGVEFRAVAVLYRCLARP